MTECALEIELLSDTAFSTGSGLSGWIDNDVQCDDLGLPVVSGRALKGILVNECAELLNCLPGEHKKRWQDAALRLFGERGEGEDQPGAMWVGDAGMPPDLVAYLRRESRLPAADILDSLTTVRMQTAVNEYGVPTDETLRTTRVVIRGVKLYAPLWLDDAAGPDDRALLAACVRALRRAGLGRTRGKGKIRVTITDHPLEPDQFAAKQGQDLTETWFKPFRNWLSDLPEGWA